MQANIHHHQRHPHKEKRKSEILMQVQVLKLLIQLIRGYQIDNPIENNEAKHTCEA